MFFFGLSLADTKAAMCAGARFDYVQRPLLQVDSILKHLYISSTAICLICWQEKASIYWILLYLRDSTCILCTEYPRNSHKTTWLQSGPLRGGTIWLHFEACWSDRRHTPTKSAICIKQSLPEPYLARTASVDLIS